jgi:guanine deaminase
MALQARLEYPQHGGSLIRRLEREGLLGPRLNLAHSVWLLQEEIDILARTGTRVVINPLSNLKLKNGFPPIRALQQAGVGIGLGCDNCSCGDAQNMFQAMKLFCLVVAMSHRESGPEQSSAAFRAATAGGAQAIGRGADLGEIEVGRRADLVLMDLTDPSYVPLNSALRQLVYTEGGRGVKTVIVDGRVVVDDGRLTTMDEMALLAEIEAVVPQFQKDYAAIKARVDRLKPYLDEAHRRIWSADVGGDRLFVDPLETSSAEG